MKQMIQDLIFGKIKEFNLADPHNRFFIFCQKDRYFKTIDACCFIGYNPYNMCITDIFILAISDINQNINYDEYFKAFYRINIKEELRNLAIHEIIKD